MLFLASMGKTGLTHDIFFEILDVSTLVCRIDVKGEINVQVGKFLKNIKHAGQNI